MTIDEVIEYCNRQATCREGCIVEWNKKFSDRCKRESEEYKQVAEWLEELKLFKELYPDADVKGSLVTNYNNGWNDGIDELADGLCCQACFTNAQKDAIRKLAEEFKNDN